MKPRIFAGAVVVAVLAVAGMSAGEALKSGPGVGEKLGGPFNVLNLTGKNAGKSNCLV